MAARLGSGEHTYEFDDEWAKLPSHIRLGDVTDIGIGRDDRVYVFNRSDHPVIVLERNGAFVQAWGEGLFRRPHGLTVAPDGTLFLTDDEQHTVRKFTAEGQLLLQLGTPDQASGYMSGRPFNRCTNTALSPDGDIYISDGYGNARVHRFSPDGKLIHSWGEPGTRPGQFNVVHQICIDDDGWVYIADRENHRVQVFDLKGQYETQWNNLHRPCGMYMRPGQNQLCYLAEAGTGLSINRNAPNIGPRVSILTSKGELVAQIGNSPPGLGADQFLSVHSIAVDSSGDIYVGETAYHSWPSLYPKEPRPAYLRTLRKLKKTGHATQTGPSSA